MTDKEAMKLALDALELVNIEFVCNGAHHAKKDRHGLDEDCPVTMRYRKAITALKERLAQPEEEPLHPVHIGVDVTREGTAVTAFYRKPDAVMEMFYSQFHPMAQPPQRTWVGLTNQEQLDIFAQSVAKKRSEYEHYKAIEQALKEKNQ